MEFAFTVPILVFLLLGLAEIGNGMNSYLTVLAAARLGAEGGATDTALTTLVTKETSRLQVAIPTTCNVNNAGICITHPVVDGAPSADTVEVQVCYNHPLMIGFPGVLPNPLLMCSQTTMRIVQ